MVTPFRAGIEGKELKQKTVKILALGDVIGEPGRNAVFLYLPEMIKSIQADFVIINGENSAGGFGITAEIAQNLFLAGADIITTGNHVWKQKDMPEFLNSSPKVLRPANYPPGAPGSGAAIIEKHGIKFGVINLLGRVFMDPMDCPFRTATEELNKMQSIADIKIIDFHAEATSEKVAMGWHLDGAASLVFGTHTHIQTADEHVLPGGTGYITDIGMVGPWDSIIGMEKTNILKRFRTCLPGKLEVAKNDIHIEGIIVDINTQEGKTEKITRLQKKVVL